jgi:hypothetical protein
VGEGNDGVDLVDIFDEIALIGVRGVAGEEVCLCSSSNLAGVVVDIADALF